MKKTLIYIMVIGFTAGLGFFSLAGAQETQRTSQQATTTIPTLTLDNLPPRPLTTRRSPGILSKI